MLTYVSTRHYRVNQKYYTAVLFKTLEPTDYTKVKRPHVHLNVLTFTSQKCCSIWKKMRRILKTLSEHKLCGS